MYLPRSDILIKESTQPTDHEVFTLLKSTEENNEHTM